MLISPRTYSASQIPDKGLGLSRGGEYHGLSRFGGWRACSAPTSRYEMALIHQAGSLRVGEIARFVGFRQHELAFGNLSI